MFVGHLALAFAARRSAPTVSLGWFVAAVTALDLLWPLFLLLGLEQVHISPGATAFTPLVFDSYPWSHSLMMATLWGLLLAGLAGSRGVPTRAAAWLAVLVVSHWALDYLTHAPDLPLWPGPSPRLGLGLWNSVPATLLVEGLLWLGGIGLYLQGRQPIHRNGPLALWTLVIVSTLLWVAGPWSPPPPSSEALAGFALVGWILVPWSAAADRNYRPAAGT